MDKLTVLKYNFDKPIVRTPELQMLFSVSDASLLRYRNSWVEEGNALYEMGCFNIEGYKDLVWCPKTFLNWLINNKLKEPIKYTHDQLEHQKLNKAVVDLTQHKKENRINAQQQ